MFSLAENILDKFHEHRNDRLRERDDVVAFAPPSIREEARYESDFVDVSKDRDRDSVAGLSVIWDDGVDETQVLPPTIWDLQPDEYFFESPPDQYLEQLLEVHPPMEYLDQNGPVDTPIVCARLPFELRREAVHINDDVTAELGRYSNVPAERDVEYDPGEQLYLASICRRGPSAKYRDAAAHILNASVRETVNSTITEPIIATKHYTIRTMTGLEHHRTERTRIGTREYHLGQICCTPHDFRTGQEKVVEQPLGHLADRRE